MSGRISGQGDAFDIFLNIIPASETYNAVIESWDFMHREEDKFPGGSAFRGAGTDRAARLEQGFHVDQE